MKKISHILIAVGALNWGLVGLGTIFGGGNWNVVNLILGGMPVIEAIVYILVGVSVVMVMLNCKSCCKGGSCDTKNDTCGACDSGKCEAHGKGMSSSDDSNSMNNSQGGGHTAM